MDKNPASMETASDLINRRKFDKAAALLLSLRSTDASIARTARYWFMHSLIQRMKGDTAAAEECRRYAETCRDYTPRMHGDFIRAETLALIRNRKAAMSSETQRQIEHNLDEMRCIFDGDTNRMASVTATEARYQAALYHYATAARLHQYADRQWQQTDDADQQWVQNNLFHWLVAISLAPLRYRESLEQDDTLSYIMHSLSNITSRKRRVAAWAIFSGSKHIAHAVVLGKL